MLLVGLLIFSSKKTLILHRKDEADNLIWLVYLQATMQQARLENAYKSFPLSGMKISLKQGCNPNDLENHALADFLSTDFPGFLH